MSDANHVPKGDEPPALAEGVSLRSVTSDDESFLLSVYASTRSEELAFTDWTSEQKDFFCRKQFEAQTTHYTTHYPGAEFFVILHQGTPAGRLYVMRWPKDIRIMDIALLPAHRSQGIGTALIAELQEEAAKEGRSVSIHVEKFNPALRLYQRLGFSPAEDKGVYLLLQWTAMSDQEGT